ncbi:alpha/beta hydrolase [Halobacillus salinarum]|uniref:Alpha/beta hydrolase n=1 Tax=Halobacillus salinarum TaxID=2932257 RepID=A0ABY4ELX0_9BACI|nr:alpha/beta hydrolase [Halobacillus salinarum]UOQ45169.1 alpha/beta hydrolase [Halobacillus salinarum]
MILHTHLTGEGDPLVFLHTGLQTGSTDFEYQREYFREHYKLVCPDLRGHGNSFSEDFNDYFYDTARDLKETLDYLNIPSVQIVGCSLGALVGIIFAKYYPDYVRSLVISGVTPTKPENWEDIHEKEVDFQRQLLRDQNLVSHFNQLHNTNWRELIYLVRQDNWYPFEETHSLADIKAPILYIVGEGNAHEVTGAVYYPKYSKVHVSVLPFASHLVHSEQPEIYTKILENFLHKTALQKEEELE